MAITQKHGRIGNMIAETFLLFLLLLNTMLDWSSPMKNTRSIFRDEEATQQREITRFIFHEGAIFFSSEIEAGGSRFGQGWFLGNSPWRISKVRDSNSRASFLRL